VSYGVNSKNINIKAMSSDELKANKEGFEKGNITALKYVLARFVAQNLASACLDMKQIFTASTMCFEEKTSTSFPITVECKKSTTTSYC